MSNSNQALSLAYQAAYRAVGLTGHEVAAARYRRAVDAAIEVLKPSIAAEALRMATTVNVSRGEGHERVYDAAMMAYYSARLGSAGRGVRLKAAIDAATPLIEAGALRAAADSAWLPDGARWPLNQLAEEIEKGEVRDVA